MTTTQQNEIELLLSELGQQSELSIIKLSEPILSQADAQVLPNGHQRTSDASSTGGNGEGASGNPTPASLEADLMHYKELFTKLRFSYVEQVTKEKFLRAIVGEPTLYVTASENNALEAQLATVKESLKSQKEEVARMVAELEHKGRDLSSKYTSIQTQMEQLRTLPNEIEGLRRTVEDLRAAQAPVEGDPILALPLQGTLEAVEKKEAELAALDHELAMLESETQRKTQELARLEGELRPLQAQKVTVIAAAKDARRRKEEGTDSIGDELEERGRWLRGVETTMRGLLEV